MHSQETSRMGVFQTCLLDAQGDPEDDDKLATRFGSQFVVPILGFYAGVSSLDWSQRVGGLWLKG